MTYPEILTATYDIRLVALSIVIAVFGSYTALDLARQVKVTQGWARKLWLTGGTLALGISIWAMHFIAMLAYQLTIPIVYDLRIVFVAMAVAIAGSGAGLFAISRQQSQEHLPLILGGLFIGSSIIILHWTAMTAMEVAASSLCNPKLMVLSAAVAIGGSVSALWLAFPAHTENLLMECGRRSSSTILMATAIVGMHYLAMAAVSFQETAQLAVQSSAINNARLAMFIGIATLLILIITLLASFFSQRSTAKLARAEAQRQSEERFRSLVQNASDVIVILTADGTVNYLSPSVKRILGYEPEARLGKKVLKLIHSEDLTKAENLWSRANRSPAVNLKTQLRLRHADRTWREFEVIVNNLLAEPSVAGIVATCRDISDRIQAEQQLRVLEIAVEQSIDGIAIADIEEKLLFINRAWGQMHACRPDEVLGQHVSIFHTEAQFQEEVLAFMERVQATGANSGELGHKRQDGTTFPTQKAVAVMTDAEGHPLGYVAIARDITERKQAEQQMLYNAFYDALTSLPNRALFMDRLEQALNQAKRQQDYVFAVLFLDLDRFKVINDSLGHSFGDQLLIDIARRLAICLRPTDTAARLGGDEFTILLEGINDISDAIRVAERIQAELRLPFTLGEQEVFTTASIGIALSATGYEQPFDLLRDADIAMYRAKLHGKARYEIFNTDMHIRAVARLQLENALRRGVEHQEFEIYYQPIVSLQDGKIIGFEALLRWQHPKRGLLPPKDFLAIAEETGLSVALDHWVLRQACRQMRQWQKAFPFNPPLTICVNFCSKVFAQGDLIEQVNSVLQETGLNAHSLKLEITESVLLENAESVIVMLQLKALGIQLAIDDFGTGFSSLGRLHSFPIDVLKIDRSFISHSGTDVANLEIVGTIVTLAHSLGVHVTAEGVETAEQLARLRELNCEYGQGYFFSLPLDSEETEVLLVAQPQW